MRYEIFALMALVGASVWAFRALPMRMDLARIGGSGALARFFAATGVAAIATLFAASMLPEFSAGRTLPALIGSAAVLAVYLPSRSVVLATLAGAAAYGTGFAFLA
jgi:hypothetical protein